MARFTLLVFIILGSIVTAFGQASQSLQGTVKDATNGEPLMFATVALKKSGQLITGAQTDFDGKYSFNGIDAGTYDVEVSYVGYNTQKTEGVVIFSGKSLTLNIDMSQGIELEEIVVTYQVPLVSQDNTTQGTVVTSKEIDKLASKNINGIIAQSAGVSSADDGGAISIRGSRSNATDYYIDGIRVSGSMIPQSEIEQLQVITGGIPASIGDVTGGVISVTTKGPSREFNGTAELETSELLDGYQYRLGMLSLSGPLLKNDRGESVIGYRFSGQYRSNADASPSAVGVYKLKDEVYDRLSADPLVQISSGGSLVGVPSANFLTEDDVELVKTRPNSGDVRYDATGKIDIQVSRNMDIAIGGSFNHRQSQPATNAIFNYNRNRTEYDTDARGFFRFRHRIGGATTATDADKASSGTSIQNASYTLQMSYNLTDNHTSDPIHGDNVFDYGYIGLFDHSENPVPGPLFDSIGQFVGLQHVANFYRLDAYTPSDINAPLTNYNKFVEDFDSRNDFPYFNGNRPQAQMSVYNLHTNVNDIYNRIDKSQSQRYQFNAKGLFEIVPRGDAKGKHTVEFGIMYEQRVERSYVLLPRNLWTIARQLTNVHFNSLDYQDSIGVIDLGNGNFITQYANLAQDAQWAAEDPANRTDGQSYFDKQLRAALGAGRKEWIDVDELSPDQLSLDYFSPTELTNAQLMGYYGYDYLGNPIGGDVSFNDFFLEKSADGEYTRRIGPNQPIYTAAYIEDKFLFKDIIFRIGLRVDRYDANTKTLKDQYSLYDAFTASEFGGTIPGAVSGDAVVYTDDGTDKGRIRAYRDGAVWYTAEGTEVNSPINIFGTDRALPALVKSNDNIQSASFDPNSTFVDAVPTINFMPRLAFSFPISEEANFFAHYDVLAQRPPSNTIATPLTYYYFLDNIQTPNYQFNNPSLLSERTVDYEVGFQQKLSASSAIKMSAYYKELRDMIQSQTYLYAFPSNYDGFGNQDFGTVKGFNFSYDMRRTGNITLRATYTLQFAQGTGSDANSQQGISNRGNLRVIYPLSFDERHRVTGTIDYRYGEGNKYTGPTVGGKQIFANAGINLTVIGASGRPYTAKLIPASVTSGASGTRGGINGSRLPWNTTLNLRIDKDFTLVQQTKEAKGMYLNVYFRVQNLLDQRNTLGVYALTGSTKDDGYIASPQGQTIVNNSIDPTAYMLSYQWRLLNPGFYTLPRRMYIGAVVNF